MCIVISCCWWLYQSTRAADARHGSFAVVSIEDGKNLSVRILYCRHCAVFLAGATTKKMFQARKRRWHRRRRRQNGVRGVARQVWLNFDKAERRRKKNSYRRRRTDNYIRLYVCVGLIIRTVCWKCKVVRVWKISRNIKAAWLWNSSPSCWYCMCVQMAHWREIDDGSLTQEGFFWLQEHTLTLTASKW